MISTHRFVSLLSLTVLFLVNLPVFAQDTVVSTLAKRAAYNGDGLSVDAKGNVFVGTSRGHQIYRVTPSGEVTLFATLDSGSANGSAFDSKGNLFVANEVAGIVHKITVDGTVTSFAEGLDGPAGVFVDEADNVIVGLYGNRESGKVLKITPNGTVSVFAEGAELTNVVGVAGDRKGRYFASNFQTGEIFEVTGGQIRLLGKSETRVNQIRYSRGFLYTPNPLAQEIRRMDLSGVFQAVAGTRLSAGSQDGTGSRATFNRPNSVDVSADGSTLYILDFNTGDVRMITLTTL